MRAPPPSPPHHLSLFSILLFVASFLLLQQSPKGSVSASASATIQDLIRKEANPRRILHQPLYPVSSTPPPAEESPSPPPPDTQAIPTPDQPFVPEVPAQATPDQPQPPPPPPPLPANGTAGAANQISQQPAKPVKRVAIAVSVGIVTLGMLSALAFFIYKHRVKHPTESRKLVGGGDSQRSDDQSRLPSPTLLYIGTVEPSSQTPIGEDKVANGSPYRKLTSAKNSDRYRPSPELQPLPPLSKPPIPVSNSPPPMSSSDEESHETNFYTPHGSSASTDEGSYTTGSLPSYPSGNSNTSLAVVAQARAETHTRTSPHPHSKRTSPKSRLSVSSPDTKHATNPSVKPPLPPPAPPPPPPLPPPAPPSFSYSPPPPTMVRLQAINNQPVQTSKISAPPPPAPPQHLGGSETSLSSIPFPDLRKLQSRIPKFKPNYGVEKPRPVKEEAIKGVVGSSSESNDPDDAEGLKPKLKPLHWDKVRATSDRATVWDQLKSSSFQLNEDMMETLFGCNSTNSIPKEPTRRSVLPSVERENRVLDPKKSQNIAILLRALNVTQDEVSEALLDGNPEGLGAELLETLVKMAPTKEEEIKLRDYKGDTSKLGSAERFLMAILDVPFAFKRVEAMLYRANFDAEVKYLRKSFETLKVASGELKNSRLFLKLLEAVLRTGNRMNVGTNRGDATAFKLETLLKLVDIKGTDGKTTLLHFVVQEIIRSEGAASDPKAENLSNKMNPVVKDEDFRKQGLQVVAGLSRELGNVKMAAGMDSDVLSSYVSKLEMGLEKVRGTLQFEKPNMQGKFFESMKTFLKVAEEEITSIKADERKALSSVKEVTEYFHGNAAKEEAHPFRIFMIVRDFLSTLDHVCKEVGKMKDTTMVGSARSFRIPATASLPVLNRYKVRQDGSDEESSSP